MGAQQTVPVGSAWQDAGMGNVVDLLSRRVYSFAQIDRILGLHGGTAARWIDGYTRAGRLYQPVVRLARTGDDVATWGELVECRFLAEYRDAGVSLQRMRPAVERLRAVTGSLYPLASAQLWVAAEGRELVARVQEDVHLSERLSLVVVRSGQQMLDWSPRAARFEESIRWSGGPPAERTLVSLVPDERTPDIEIDPQRGYGDPVIRGRGVTTSVIRELVQAGEPLDSIAESYELKRSEVESALRFELMRAG